MKATFACACVLAACPAVAMAEPVKPSFSGVTIYGNFDEYYGYIHSTSGAHVVGLNDGAILRSRLGFRGTEDLVPGYQIKFNLELGYNADTGTFNDPSRLFDRQAWVSANTPAGELRIGRQHTEIFLIGGAIDYTERTTFGSLINTFPVPSRYDNDISFKTERWEGVQATVHYALPENTGGARNYPIYQLALDYQKGPYRVGYAGLLARPNSATATVPEHIKYHNAYLNYKYGQGTLYAAFVRSNNSTANVNGLNAAAILSTTGVPNNFFPGTDLNARRFYNIWQLSADYRFTTQLRVGFLFGQMVDTSGGDAGSYGGNVGGFFDVTKRTTLYTFVSYLKNQANAGFRFSSSAAPSVNLAGNDVNGKGLSGLQVGVVHRF
jgi:predicted porin